MKKKNMMLLFMCIASRNFLASCASMTIKFKVVQMALWMQMGLKFPSLCTRTYNMHNNSRTSRISLEALLMILYKNIGRLKNFSMNLTHNFENEKNQTRMIQ
jgi:hypothetical protein